MKKETITISVKHLIEFVLQSGDIIMGIAPSSRAVEGIKGHKEFQKTRGEDYKAEVPLSIIVESEHVKLKISGKADGIFRSKEGLILEEIKTVEQNPVEIEEDAFPLHWAQARIYGYMLLKNKAEDLKEIILYLTYYNNKTKESHSFQQNHTIETLSGYFDNVSEIYIDWLESINLWNEDKNNSIKKITFPFASYRKGQREMAVAVYRTLRDGGKLFVQAPTGIGKTLAVLFPAIKALAEQDLDKIFYLTARTIARTVAEDSLLIDDRFLTHRYKRLLPHDWQPIPVTDPSQITSKIRGFD